LGKECCKPENPLPKGKKEHHWQIKLFLFPKGGGGVNQKETDCDLEGGSYKKERALYHAREVKKEIKSSLNLKGTCSVNVKTRGGKGVTGGAITKVEKITKYMMGNGRGGGYKEKGD